MAGSWGRLWEKWGGRQHGEVLEMTNEGVQGGLNFAIIFSLSLQDPLKKMTIFGLTAHNDSSRLFLLLIFFERN